MIDEPAVVTDAMWDALSTGLGKTDMLLLCVGTLSPAPDGHWWRRLVEAGSRPGVHVELLQGDVERWDDWGNLRSVTPLLSVNQHLRPVLKRERAEARRDPAAKARYLSLRLNVPSGDESTVLLTVPEWRAVTARAVAPREGRPVCGVDLGGGRAWSAAVAIWPSGRVEALAVAPGIPDVESQERRDRVPRGTYARLVEGGALTLAEGLRVPKVSQVVDAIREWRPTVIVCDRFRLPELHDARPGCPVGPRVARWSEQSEDIRALRRFALDGPLTVAPGSRGLVGASLAVAMVRHDDAGNVRLVKRGTNNTGRDDTAAALILAAGARSRIRPPRPLRVHVA